MIMLDIKKYQRALNNIKQINVILSKQTMLGRCYNTLQINVIKYRKIEYNI